MNVDEILCDYNVFLTGASGFVGIVLLKRLLNIKNADNSKIFCLLRCGKKYNTVIERLRNEILTNEILELRENDINDMIANKRIIPIEGELTEELLGLDNKIISTLKYSHNTNNKKGIIIIHCAADIDFNREINQSININVYGTYQCIQIGSEIDAKSFIHISTLYVNSREHRDKHVYEQIYDSGLNFVDIFKKWLSLKEKNKNGFDEKHVAKIKSITCRNNPLQRQQWPNNYTFTKNMAENVVLFYCNKLNIKTSIIRLGIVSPIHRGKHLGWFMGNGGFVFLVIGLSTGNIRYLNGDGLGRPDFVPVDYTVDTIIGVTAAIIKNKHKQIYQCGVIAAEPEWTVTTAIQYARPKFFERKLPYLQKGADATFIQSKTLFFAIELIFYEIPLVFASILAFFISLFSIYYWLKIFYNFMGYQYDTNLNILRNKKDLSIDEQIRSLKLMLYDKPYTFVKRTNFMKKARGKLSWFHKNYTYFVNQRWCFDHSNVCDLYDLLDKQSKEKYNFDVNKIEFNKYATESALVCFNKYINYRNNKKTAQIKVEQEMKAQLDFLQKQQKQHKQQKQQEIHINSSLSKAQKLQILDVLRKLFFMVGVDAKVSFCIFFGLSIVGILTFFVL